ncbi:MAG: bifunctional aldolase/short-chain dehydrogenase [Alphaproteobacteria bacterium]|nr:bifunctional aldolase/short-chain dehydrogenase [Alphaproteobacteria bacterium]
MVENLWNTKIAEQFLTEAGEDSADQQLALRVYTSQLLGQNPDLVMHGGGNTSVKVDRTDIFGNSIKVLHVKGSGWDLETIQAPGLPAVNMAPLANLRNLETLSDEDMVNIQRSNLLDSKSPNPSVETLLHAYIPHKFVDHTHATSMLALANLPDVEKITKQIFGDRVALVPYIMPGFSLSKTAADIFDANPDIEGMMLINHGHFTFANSAKKSYDLMIEHVNLVEDWLTKNTKPEIKTPQKIQIASEILPILRGVLSTEIAKHTADPDCAAPIFDLRSSSENLSFLMRDDLAELATRGVATPDHVIRTKGHPLLLTADILAQGKAGIQTAVAEFIQQYKAYFNQQVKLSADSKTMLCPTPNLAWIPGLGILGIGANASAARIAADIGEQTCQVMQWAQANGGFYPIGDKDLFEMEYWSLEQAKLGSAKPKVFNGKIVVVTGAAGAIGVASAKAFKDQGANLFLVDRDEAALKQVQADFGQDHAHMVCDITQENAANDILTACVKRFGGVDILVSNAGAAWQSSMVEMDDETLMSSFNLNFFSHHKLAQQTAKILQTQDFGGQLLFNVSKQAVNPGKGFGAYGLPKATTLFLVKQLALELGENNIRVNGINADRIRSGLLDDEFIETRSKARGVDTKTYMAGNLLHREVEAKHVADGFVMLAKSERTTAHILTVDGGNIEASLR